MNLLLTGPIEGHLADFYTKVVPMHSPHWVVCAGDFGVHPDPQFMDKAAKKHAGRDFAKMYVGAIRVPLVSTLFIAGVHDDQQWLNRRVQQRNTVIIEPFVHYLHQGNKTTIGWEVPLRVTGLGRAYSEATYRDEPSKRSYRHYTRRDVERACSSGPTDLFVCYENPEAPGIKNVIFATRPKLILTVAHPNQNATDSIQGIPVIALERHEVASVEWRDGTFHQ